MKDFQLEAKHIRLEGKGVVNIDKGMASKLHSLFNLHTLSKREGIKNLVR